MKDMVRVHLVNDTRKMNLSIDGIITIYIYS